MGHLTSKIRREAVGERTERVCAWERQKERGRSLEKIMRMSRFKIENRQRGKKVDERMEKWNWERKKKWEKKLKCIEKEKNSGQDGKRSKRLKVADPFFSFCWTSSWLKRLRRQFFHKFSLSIQNLSSVPLQMTRAILLGNCFCNNWSLLVWTLCGNRGWN